VEQALRQKRVEDANGTGPNGHGRGQTPDVAEEAASEEESAPGLRLAVTEQ
jgi:hypothetical protein